MSSINRGDQLLLTEAVKEITSQNRLTETVNVKVTVSVNTSIFIDIYLLEARLS